MIKFPENCLQYLVDEQNWWEKTTSQDICRWRLIWTFVAHVDQIPFRLEIKGRTNPTDHTLADFEIKPLYIRQQFQTPSLPVAGLPCYAGEIYTVHRSKRRPAIVIALSGDTVSQKLTSSFPKWQFAPHFLVAPYYGIESTYKRSGYPSEFIKKVKLCAYRQFFWDYLPIGSESILRFDHIQPVGHHHQTFELTDYILSERAQEIMDEYLYWFLERTLSIDDTLFQCKKLLSECFEENNQIK